MKSTTLSFVLGLGFGMIAVPAWPATPTQVITDSDGISGFELYGSGALWWDAGGVCGGEFPHDANVKIRAANINYGTKSLAEDCDLLQGDWDNAVRDDAYIYFFRNRQLHRKALSAAESDPSLVVPTPPHTPTLSPQQAGSAMILADLRVWYSRYYPRAGLIDIFSFKTDGSENAQYVASISGATAPVRKLDYFTFQDANGSSAQGLGILLANGKLYRKQIGGNLILLATGAADFATHTTKILALPQSIINTSVYVAKGVEGIVSPGTPTGGVLKVDPTTGAATAIYTAPLHHQVVSVATDSDSFGFFGLKNLYITEMPVSCGELFCTTTAPVIKRNQLPGTDGSWDLIVPATSSYNGGVNLRSDDQWLYMLWNDRVLKVKTDAPAVELDIQALALEVTQGIQTMNGDMPLIARRGKSTFVRGYAYLPVNTTGSGIWFPDATLRAFLNGTEIEGSPFKPVNNASISGTASMSTLRPALNQSFLFEIPTLQAGSLTLTMTVNPEGTIAETGPSPFLNNSVSLPQSMPVVESIGVALQTYAMPTAAGTYEPDEAYSELISRAESLLPARFIMTVRASHGWGDDVYFTDSTDPDRDDDALDKIECIRKQTSSSGGSTFHKFKHWVGMIHPGVPNFNGLGYRPGQSLIARMAEAGGGFPDPDSPLGGRTLAHEMSHNYGRKHVNCTDSSQSPDNTDDNYPFNDCTIASGNAMSWFGFDPLTQTVIDPNNAVGDLLSYRSSRWPSSYTWSAIFGNYQFLNTSSLAGGSGGGADTDAGPYLFVNGYIRPEEKTAMFHPFYAQPAAMIDPVILNEDLYVGSVIPDGPLFATLRYLDGDGRVLQDYTLMLRQPEAGQRMSFAQWLPFHPEAGRVQLLWQEIMMTEQTVSPQAPQLQLGIPSFDPGNQTLRLSWTASDPDGDSLRCNVYYSRDGGNSWDVLLNNYRGLSAAMDTAKLAGSPAALLRVSVTDGILTTSADTAPFSLPDNPPQVILSGVTDGQEVPFGTTLRLSGLVLDAEDQDAMPSLQWDLSGPMTASHSDRSWTLRELIPGNYQVTLSAVDSAKQQYMVVRPFVVLPLTVPEGSAPRVDGHCNDAAYRNAALLRLPSPDGDGIPTRLVHAGGYLYVSMSGLDLGRGPARAGLRVDVDGNRSPLAQPGDVGFFVDSDGIPSQEVGDGNGMVVTDTPQAGFTAAVVRGLQGKWSAEFKIADALIGGWDHPAGLMFEHGGNVWPALADGNEPATWAAAYLGDVAPASANRAPLADAGVDQLLNMTAPRLVVLDGSHSHDPDGDAVSHQWVQVGGPAVTLSSAQAANPSFTAAMPEAPTTLVFQLTVSDGELTSATDPVRIALFPSESVDPVHPEEPIRPGAYHMEEGVFYGEFHGKPGEAYRILASGDFKVWETIWLGEADDEGLIAFKDAEAQKHRSRFYKAEPK